ncbi:twin-arginine translocase subunit TatC [Brevibacillus dissolubilis]|uniref:twin-arginine translocase subunit TatC n=1 Tax=Brevibacillus dissolubilis TaxID=1844116 RepID=UPI0011160FF4|nr:twin-arginine translocase subunit TatC [Brevibacillus dissolubilis]
MQEMNLIDHVADLRKRLLITFSTFIISVVVCFLYVEPIYEFLSSRSGEKLTVLGPLDILGIYMKLAAVGAIAITIPVAAYQLWRFVAPALTKQERKVTLMYVPALFLLFVFGVSFSYFVLFPMMYQFALGLAQGNFELLITANEYFNFLLNMTIPFGIIFEMPIVVLFLSQIGIVNPHRLGKLRKPAYLLLTIVSVTITPPDLVSDVLVIVPLFLLYEASILISRVVYRKQKETEELYDSAV